MEVRRTRRREEFRFKFGQIPLYFEEGVQKKKLMQCDGNCQDKRWTASAWGDPEGVREIFENWVEAASLLGDRGAGREAAERVPQRGRNWLRCFVRFRTIGARRFA